MPGRYENPISVKQAIDLINSRDLLLPSIQRKFVWSSHQICVLFDSLMRGFPINSFMLWEVKSESIKNNYKFYEFLKSYCQRFEEDNPHQPTSASFKDFKAVIDGQQRLTSLYIGLCGTYAYKNPRVHWPSAKDESVIPPRRLYLNIKAPLVSEDDEALMEYDFRFLTDSQYKNSTDQSSWFCINNILQFPPCQGADEVLFEVVIPELERRGLGSSDFSRKTLLKLHEVIHSQPLIHYFCESSQDIDYVLRVFIRTNSGGTKLDFSDLLMSIVVAHWDGDFRKELDDLTKQIHQDPEMGFFIERDWLLKACLVLTGADVRFKVGNFKNEQVSTIQKNWAQIKDCVLSTFRLVRRFGINPPSLTSKNAVLPICYYLFLKKENGVALYHDINNLSKFNEQRKAISQWLYMALLKGVFGGQADTILASMRDVINDNLVLDHFPVSAIIDRYVGTSKDLRFDEAGIDKLLETEHGEGRCRTLLHLLFPEMNPTEVFHIDHLHPRSQFAQKILDSHDFLARDERLMEFFKDPRHWNSIPNLHLLNHSQNQSKNDKPLKDWLDDKDVHLSQESLLIENVDPGFESFKEFYHVRRDALKRRLMSRVFISATASLAAVDDSDDEEIFEDRSS